MHNVTLLNRYFRVLGLILQQKTVPIEVWIEYLKDQKTF